MSRDVSVIILAAGLGTRMASSVPKVLHGVGGLALVGHVARAVGGLGAGRVVAVVGPGMGAVVEAVRAGLPGVAVAGVEQAERKGTGHAVLAARAALAGRAGPVVVVYGDTPLIQAATLRRLAAEVGRGRAVAVAGMRPVDPGPYGRLVTGADGALERIVEARDASPAERAIGLCNAGVMAVDGRVLWDLLDQVRPDNAKGEYYLTDLVHLARGARAAVRGDRGGGGRGGGGQLAGRAGRGGGAVPGAQAPGGDAGGGDAGRSGERVVQPRHGAGARRGGGAVRGVRAGGCGGGRRGDQGVLPPRGGGDRGRRAGGAVRAAAARGCDRAGGAYRQFRRDQGGGDRGAARR